MHQDSSGHLGPWVYVYSTGSHGGWQVLRSGTRWGSAGRTGRLSCLGLGALGGVGTQAWNSEGSAGWLQTYW